MAACRALKYLAESLVSRPTSPVMTKRIPRTSSVSFQFIRNMAARTPRRVTVLLIMLGRALDSISRRVSVSLVNRDMISPWVRLSKYLRGSFSKCSNISQRI